MSVNSHQTYIHKELAPSRIERDIKAVEKVVELLDDVFTNPWRPNTAFTSLSTGVEATDGVKDDLLEAGKRKGKEKQAANKFVVNRCLSSLNLDYFEP